MPELYTSLTRLKMAMNNGQLPPMTPLTENALKIIDPTFTIGMGALTEDVKLGLRCPIKGCGQYHHDLGTHIRWKHKAVGGTEVVRMALSLPKSVGLLSRRARQVAESKAKRLYRDVPHVREANIAGRAKAVAKVKAGGRRASRNNTTVNGKNLLDRCVAQLSHKIMDLQNVLGRSPSVKEMRKEYGAGIMFHIYQAFGTWDNALLHCGLSREPQWRKAQLREQQRAGVLAALKSWYQEHNTLPDEIDATDPRLTPFLPNPRVVIHALGSQDWRGAMRIAAALLDIRGGKYGLPVGKTA